MATVPVADPSDFSAAYPVDLKPISLVWKNLSVKGSDGRPLLHPTSGEVRTGITAIIAPTGAGKTTLLNALASVVTSAQVSGEVRLNGQLIQGGATKTLVSFVSQDDVLDGHMTVGECLHFAAQMQLGHLPEEERAKLVDSLLKELGIAHVVNTLIGTATIRGISGGQRRRVSVALGLLRRPRVIILDEPTCGLDSTTALRLVKTLHRIAHDSGVLVLMPVHQPQQAIFDLFDDLICLRGGRIIYNGGARACIDTLANMGFPHDGVTGYADHIVEAIAPRLGQTLVQKEAECPLLQCYVDPSDTIDLNQNSDVSINSTVTVQPWLSQFRYCFERIGRAEARKYGTHMVNLLSTVGCALLIGGAYYNIPMTQGGAKLRLAVLFFCCVNQSLFGAMKVILAFPDARALAIAERRAGLYALSPQYLAYTAVDLVQAIVWPFLFALPVVFMSGLQTGARFLGFVLILYLDKVCATSLAMMIAAITRITSAALVVLPMALEMSRLFSGYYLAPNAVPSYYVWLDPLSYVKYAYVGACLNELENVQYACTKKVFNATTNVTLTGICDITLPRSGRDQIIGNGYDFISYGGCVGVLIGYLIFTRAIGYVALRVLKS